MNPDLLQGFYLDDLLIEPLRGQVSGRGRTRHLPPKAVEVLLQLASEPGELVPRATLLEAVWGEGQGTDESLTHAVSEIRQALDDRADAPHFVQTIPRRGYRLIIPPSSTAEGRSTIVIGADDRSLSELGLMENLRRRGVLETGLAYLILGWLVIQIADIVFARLHLPEWIATFVTVLVIAGFPIALALSWFLEIRQGNSVLLSPHAERRQRFSRTYLSVISAFAIAGVLVFVYDVIIGLPGPDDVPVEESRFLPPVRENAIAVLPFFNIDGSAETEVFANGLVDDVINSLTRVPGLLVSARGDSFSLAPNTPSTRVRERLRVALYLEGSVQIEGERLRVIVQLIDSAQGIHILSRSFDRMRKDFFELRDEITNLTVANVRVSLPKGVLALPAVEVEDPSLDAYVLYRRGIDVSRQPGSKSQQTALEWFSKALEVDPDFGAAHAGKCSSYVNAYTSTGNTAMISAAESSCARALSLNPHLDVVHVALGNLYSTTGNFADAEREYLAALELDPRSVAATTGLGDVYASTNQPQRAEQAFRQAVELQPGGWSAYNQLGGFLFEAGRFREAAEQYETVVALDDNNAVGHTNLGTAYMLSGDFARAAPAFAKAIGIAPEASTYSNLGLMQYYLGRVDDAVDSHLRATELAPEDPLTWSNLGDALWISGREAEAREAFERAAAGVLKALEVNPDNPYSQMDLAWIRAMLGNMRRADELIKMAGAQISDDPYLDYIRGLILLRNGDADGALDALAAAANKGYPTEMMAAEPHLASLRDNRRFRTIVDGR